MHILIVLNNSNEGAVDASRELMAHLERNGMTYTVRDSFELPRLPGHPVDGEDDSEGLMLADEAGVHRVELVVVLGGDGTVLRAARMVSTSGVPIIGINFGHLGFLSNPSDDGVVRIVEAALAGDVVREERANLNINVGYLVNTKPGEAQLCRFSSYFALNELAVTRGSLGRVVDVSVTVNGDRFANIRGDGVIIASSTGSTAYALSAGGPMVAPSHAGMVMVPIAPHSLRSRPLVTAPGEVVTLELSQDKATRAASHFIDGDLLSIDGFASRFRIRTGSRPTTLLRYDYNGFYSYAAKTFL